MIAALESKLHVQEHIPAYLGAQTALVTTACIVNELKMLGEVYAGAYLATRKLEHRRCGHSPALTGSQCLMRLIGESGNPHKLLVATQDYVLRQRLRKVPCVPILYVDYNCAILEAPSDASQSKASKLEHNKLGASSEEKHKLKQLVPLDDGKPKFRRKVAQEPNSLASKKAAVKPTAAASGSATRNGDAFALTRGMIKKLRRKRMALIAKGLDPGYVPPSVIARAAAEAAAAVESARNASSSSSGLSDYSSGRFAAGVKRPADDVEESNATNGLADGKRKRVRRHRPRSARAAADTTVDGQEEADDE
ncbi:hypothetical protein CAOG_007670 [Capsaspora owczarzaki ATCC 30864]|uniref:rRNA-processing protein UTP23 n=2 Tax=Capsaspora owczarzaki (strain ATCC 30864) TaxID=595528 RepID=A0A0D2WX06_CAPO3|nr:hypothetical protein CAOG_007670 [Capsaspora owczarzaki ATCC 30864]